MLQKDQKVYTVNDSDKIRTIPEKTFHGIGVERESSSSALVQKPVTIPNPSKSRGKHKNWKHLDSNVGPDDFR